MGAKLGKKNTLQPEEEKHHSVSLLENLPREVVWEIIKYTDEAILSLRKASRALNACVGEYAFQRPVPPLVSTLRIGTEESQPNTIKVSIQIRERRNSRLFNLRQIQLPKFDLKRDVVHTAGGFTMRLRLRNPSRRLFISHALSTAYSLTLEATTDNRILINYLRDCIGREVEEVYMKNCDTQAAFSTCSEICNGIRIGNLCFKTQLLSESSAQLLQSEIITHKIGHITFSVAEFAMSDPVQVLLNASATARSICIQQNEVLGETGPGATYMFGVENADWPAIILEMFSRKMDKLSIYTSCKYPDYLTIEGAALLKKRLPKLGKKIWFVAELKKYAGNKFEYTSHDHSVRGCYGLLMVKHVARLGENYCA